MVIVAVFFSQFFLRLPVYIQIYVRVIFCWCFIFFILYYIKFLNFFMCRGANPRAVNGEGKNPFEVAVESNFDDGEVIALLADSNG